MYAGVGYNRITASGVVGNSGHPVAIHTLHIESKAGGPGIVTLYDGTSTSGTKTNTEKGATNQGQSFIYTRGLVHPSGLYVNLDTNTNAAIVWFEMLG